MNDLPDDLKASKSLQKFADKAGVAKSYVELEARLGKSAVIPDQTATAEDWNKFYSRIGRPDTPEGYEMPQGKLTAEQETAIRKRVHALNLTKAQGKQYAESILQETESMRAAEALARETAAASRQSNLEKVYGPKLPDVLKKADKVFSSILPAALQERISKSEFKSDPDMIGFLAQLADEMGEDRLVPGAFDKKKPEDRYAWMRDRFPGK